MSISDEVNVDMLNECFELGPFHGLRREHPDDVTKPPDTPLMTPADNTSQEKAALGQCAN